jgi:hypothetical protein
VPGLAEGDGVTVLTVDTVGEGVVAAPPAAETLGVKEGWTLGKEVAIGAGEETTVGSPIDPGVPVGTAVPEGALEGVETVVVATKVTVITLVTGINAGLATVGVSSGRNAATGRASRWLEGPVKAPGVASTWQATSQSTANSPTHSQSQFHRVRLVSSAILAAGVDLRLLAGFLPPAGGPDHPFSISPEFNIIDRVFPKYSVSGG